MNCKICDKTAEENHDGYNQIVNCAYCGNYKFAMSYEPDTYPEKLKFYKVTSWIKEQNDLFNNVPLLDNDKFDEVLAFKDRKIKEKFDLVMNYLSSLAKYETLNEKILVKCWLKNTDELNIIIQKAQKDNFIDVNFRNTMSGYSYPTINNLTFNGLEYLEKLEEPNKNSKKIFVAFNFDEPLTNIFNTDLKSAIEIEGFEYVVVNQENVEHNKSINDEIIVKLKTSRIVIADFTNHRQSVYFEAGFAMGMNIPIIWTCQKGHESDMSFDTRQFPHILWEDKDDLVKQVINRIKRIL